MSTVEGSRPDYQGYLDHAFTLNEHEVALRDELLAILPPVVIDSHVHSAEPEAVDLDGLPDHIFGHMVTTYPITSLEHSTQIDRTLMPGQAVRKLRFAHAFAGIDHKAVNAHLLVNCPEGDLPALFGVAETDEDITYTVAELDSGKYSGFKMYYNSGPQPKPNLYEYFPPVVLAAAERNNVPIILHLPKGLYRSGDELADVATRFPDLKIVLAHVGVMATVTPEAEALLTRVSQLPNVHVDTARVHNAELIALAVKHLGIDRVLYGSDEPLNLLRSVVYINPELQTHRLLTDYPYHWADPEEQARWGHLAPRFVHSQWEQLAAIRSAIQMAGYEGDDVARGYQAIFHDNAKRVFGFSD